MIVADRQKVAGEGHVGVGEAEEGRAAAKLGRGAVAGDPVVGDRRNRRGQALGVGGIEEAGRLGQAGNEGQVAGRLTCVAESGGQGAAGIAGLLARQGRHAVDLGLLFVGHVVGEAEQHRIVGGAGPREQVGNHLHRPLVVGDHQLEEPLVEVGAAGGGERGHLFRRGHARHADVGRAVLAVIHPGHGRVAAAAGGGVLAALAQPAMHEFDLVGLGRIDTAGDVADRLGVGPPGDERGHLDGLGMVQDHVLHEFHVVGGIAVVGDARGFLAAQGAGGLARRAGLYDRGILREGAGGAEQDAGGDGGAQKLANGRRGSMHRLDLHFTNVRQG